MRVFELEGPVYQFLERVFDLMLLHLLWVLCSIPIITIGASTTALFSVTLKMDKKEESYIAKSFWKAFRENFKQSTLLWLAFGGSIAWCIVMIVISMKSGSGALKILALAEAAIVFILFTAMQYVFGMIAAFENTVWITAKNAVYVSLKFFPYSIGMIAIIILPIIVTAYVSSVYSVMLFIWLFFGSSCLALLQSCLLNKVFDICKKGETTIP